MNNHWCRTVGQNPCRTVFDFPVQHVIAIFQCGLRVKYHVWHPQLKVFVCWDRHWWWGRPVPFPIPGLSQLWQMQWRAELPWNQLILKEREWSEWTALCPPDGGGALPSSTPGRHLARGWCSTIISWQWVFSNSFVVFWFFFCVQDRITVKP